MPEHVSTLEQITREIASWPIWHWFQLVPSQVSAAGSIFGLAEYLASLALFLVILTTSDFRYTYRLSLTRMNLRLIGFWLGLFIGISLLFVDVWFEHGLPVPRLLSNANDIKGILGLLYLSFIFQVIWTVAVRPPSFTKSNARQFFGATYHSIHQGNSDRLQIVAEELRHSAREIVGLAAEIRHTPNSNPTTAQALANDFLLLIADQRFCKTVVDKAPALAFAFFIEAQKYSNGANLPIFQFARNIGEQFIKNTNSAFYQEDSGYSSGFVGYMRPVTNIIFGKYDFIEKCASDGASPLESDQEWRLDEQQMKGFVRAGLAFIKGYLEATKGLYSSHSYAEARLFDSFRTALIGTYTLNGREDYFELPAYARLAAVVDFIRKAIRLVAEHATPPHALRIAEIRRADVYDDLARLIFETILAASSVTLPVETCWSIQHNTVWGDIFSFEHSKAADIIAFKVRRLLFEEIKRMDKFANFKGARILGYCLNVLGLTLTNRHRGYGREFYPLQAVVLNWIQKNYRTLLIEHPNVAKACLHGSVEYDPTQHRLMKTYADRTGKEPSREYMRLAEPY